jgi:hypothetical protein
MIGHKHLLPLCAALLIAAPAMAAQPTQGDSGFSARTVSAHLTAPQAADFAKQIENNLAAKGARLAIVFRTGRTREKLPDGISYTHGAFWAYGNTSLTDGRVIKGYGVNNLYHGDGTTLPTNQSYLKQDFPLDFVRGTAVDDVAVIIPSPEMQRRILQIMASSQYEALHIRDYALVANPLTAKYQNCNEFMLDVIASAAWETTNYAQIKANLSAHYQPTPVKTNILQRTFGPMADDRLQLDDHKGQIRTATYESMAKFMKDQGLLQDAYVIKRDVK